MKLGRASRYDEGMKNETQRTATVTLAVVAGTILVLSQMGRTWWCSCGTLIPWSWDIWSSHNSQHLIDPYFFSHVLHGVLFFAMLRPISKISDQAKFVIAIVVEAGWEILENSPIIIDRYRAVTISLDYYGDTIANSIVDIAACGLGYIYSANVRWWWSLGLFALIELVMLLTIRDSLALNILMLVHPLDVIKEWQMGGSGQLTVAS